MTHANIELNDGSLLLLNDDSELILNEIGVEHQTGGGHKKPIRFGPRNIFTYKTTVTQTVPLYGAISYVQNKKLNGVLLFDQTTPIISRIITNEPVIIRSKTTLNQILEVYSKVESIRSAIIEGLISRKFLKLGKATKLLALMEIYDD